MTVVTRSMLLAVALLCLGAAVPVSAKPTPPPPTAEPYVHIQFDEHVPIWLDVEADYTSAAQVVKFTVTHTCDATVTANVTPPPNAPSLLWEWSFQPGGEILHLNGAGTLRNGIKVHVKGVTVHTPAGRYEGGVLTIDVAAI